MLYVALYACYLLFLPRPFSLVDPETVDALVFDYGYAFEDSFRLHSNQASKTPLIIPISPSSILSHGTLDFAIVFDCSYSDA